MCDQLKALGKYLIAGFLLSFAFADELNLDASRLVKGANTQTLETGIWSYQKDHHTLDLVGVVHLADATYYDDLNNRFESYDAVFFEMIANKAAIQALQSDTKTPTKPQKGNLGGLNKMYSLFQTMMNLSLQTKKIDYSKENFIHADMSAAEFREAQKKANETVSTFLMKSKVDASQIDQGTVMRAMMTGDSTLLKSELIALLAKADNSFEGDGASSVVLGARNDTCLTTVYQHLSQNPKLKNVAIFYGAAHLPDFHKKLTANGWALQSQNWLPAWKISSLEPQEK